MTIAESIANEIIALDGDKCYANEIELSQIYKAFWNYINKPNELSSLNIQYLMEILSEIEKLLIEK